MINVKDYMWSVANRLVQDHGYTTIQVPEKLEENEEQKVIPLNLMKKAGNRHIYVRLVHLNFIWPNHLERDMQGLRIAARQLLDRLSSSNMTLVNLYIFDTTPEKEIQELISNADEGNDKHLDTFFGYIDLSKEQIGIPREAFDTEDLTMEPFISYLSRDNRNDSEDMKEEIKTHEKNRLNELKSVFTYGKPYLTYIFIAINALIFLIMTFSGGSTNTEILLGFGAKESYLIMTGEYWRLITPIFLHIGFLHFAFNNLAIFYLGRMAESIYGSVRFFFIYMVSGVIGNIASFILSPDSIAAGASGAIFGIFGALLYFGLMRKELFFKTIGKDIIGLVLINLVFGFTMPNIDNFAHLGGLLGGFIFAAIINLPKLKRRIWAVTIASIIALLAISGYTWVKINSDELIGSQAVAIYGSKALEEGDIKKAEEIYNFLATAYPDEPFNLFQVANIAGKKGDYDKAIQYYKRTIELKKDYYEAYYNLALLYIFVQDYEQAKSYLEEVLELNPEYDLAKSLLNANFDRVKVSF